MEGNLNKNKKGDLLIMRYTEILYIALCELPNHITARFDRVQFSFDIIKLINYLYLTVSEKFVHFIFKVTYFN